MSRAVAMLLVGTIALAPSTGAGDTFACKDASGTLILGNVGNLEQERCVGRVKHIASGGPAQGRRTPGSSSGAAARAILLAPTAYRDHVRSAAEKYSLSEELLHAVMAAESGFRPDAVSEKGAIGLMQLMPGTAREMYVRDVWSPEQNIYGGARYLRILANRYQGDLVKTLAAYNAGPEAVDRARGIPNYPETQAYVFKVLDIYEKLKRQNAKG